MQEPKVLIVDDEEEARMYIANVLSDLFAEFQILFASSASEASFLINRETVQVILLDVELPGKSGLELLEKMKNEGRNIPVIFVSAYKRAEFIQQALRLDAVDYIDKPVNPIELDKAIRKALHIKTPNFLIDQFIAEKNNHIQNKIRLNTQKGTMFYEADEIVMFESQKRDAFAHFTNGSKLLIKNNLVNLMKILPLNIFFHVNRQYIVNVNFINGVCKSDKNITLKNSNFVISPVSKQVLNYLTQKYNVE